MGKHAQTSTTAPVIQYGAEGSVLRNLPTRPAAAENLLKEAVWWIDASHQSASAQIVDNLGWGGPELSASVGSTGSPDSNDPLFLDWVGDNYVYLPGLTSNSLSVPDEDALDITGDIDIRVQVAMDNWTPAALSCLVGKRNTNTSTTTSYSFDVRAAGTLDFRWTDGGGTARLLTSSVVTGITDGAVKWVRAVFDADNGAGECQVLFYLSDDGVTWTQLGTTQVGNFGTSSIIVDTQRLDIGARSGAASAPTAGKFYRAIVKNGIDGPSVLDVDTSRITSGSDTSFTARTGQVVSINRSTSGRKSVAVTQPCWLFGTDDYLEVADNDLLDFGATDSFTVVAVVRQWATPSTDRLIWKGLNTTVPVWGLNITTNTEINLQLNEGTNYATANVSLTAGGISVAAGIVNRTSGVANAVVNNIYSTNKDIAAMGSLASSEVMRVGVAATGSNYADIEFVAAAVFRRALTSGEITAITSYFQNRIGA
jgi:hypothetical protein